jgi:putative endonuclease
VLTQKAGRIAEDKALAYLKARGLHLVGRNYSCTLGEIDLVMRDGSYLVFIEVRSRVNTGFGSGAVSVTYAKQQKIIKATQHYILKNQVQDKYPLRFDVISIDGSSESITWLKDAFGADY